MTKLDDDSDVYLARRKKRRSGSLNRKFFQHGIIYYNNYRKAQIGKYLINIKSMNILYSSGVLSGLRKMVSGSVNTPATVRENTKTPVLSKSAAKRKFDSYEGLSSKAK